LKKWVQIWERFILYNRIQVLQRDKNTMKREIIKRRIVKGFLSITVLCLLGCNYGEDVCLIGPCHPKRTYCEKTKGEDIIAAGRGDECFSSRRISLGFYTGRTIISTGESDTNSLVLYSSEGEVIKRDLNDTLAVKPVELTHEEWNGREWNGKEWRGMWKDSSYFSVRNNRFYRFRFVDGTFSRWISARDGKSYKRNVTDSSYESGNYRDDDEDERGDEYRIKWRWGMPVKVREENEGWPPHLDWGNTSD
jgi:hypothetical protein